MTIRQREQEIAEMQEVADAQLQEVDEQLARVREENELLAPDVPVVLGLWSALLRPLDAMIARKTQHGATVLSVSGDVLIRGCA